MRLSAALLLFFSMMSLAQAVPDKIGDTIFVNGDVYTGPVRTTTSGQTTASRVQAIAVGGDRVLAIGTNDEVRRHKGDKTKVVDLGGHFVIPGFNDAHLHLVSGGFEKLEVDLTGTKSLGDMQGRIAASVGQTKPGEWIVGRGWDHTVWPDQKLPARQDIDSVTGDHPAFFVRVDGHIAIANTAALRAAAIVADTADPNGGKIDRDAQGAATGILRETAQELVRSKIPQPTPEQRRHAIELALAEAARWGVTSAQDNSSWEDFLVYEDLEREGKLTLRITEWLPFDQAVPYLEKHRAHQPQTDMLLHTGMLKGFMDGSLGSRTAALLAPYADDPKNSGLPQYQPAKLNQMSEDRVAARFQMGFHAIGDGGVQMALDAFADAERYAREKNVAPLAADGFRFRVEHAQVITPEQLKRFRDLHVIASMQPNHLLTDMNWAMARLGAERARYSYAWKAFLDNGVALAFGTDYPVEPITPFRGLYAAITRKNEAGTREYFPEQKITIEQAVAAYTTGAAYAEFAERDKGRLAPGMLADFVVLDRDLTKVTPREILGTRVLRTVVGGKTVYEANQQ
jgi:predicted amidohydrolase YtcJ